MSDAAEKLRKELEAAQRTLVEAQARCERHDAEHQAAAKELEDNRSALLFMLEDLEASRRKVEQAHQEWMAALDVVEDPIFLHDKEFRILRCNKAYQQCAGIPFHEIIGQLYYEVFPKNHAPMPCCLRAMEKTEEEEEEEEEVVISEAIYRSRAFSIRRLISTPCIPSKISPRAAAPRRHCTTARKNSAKYLNRRRTPSS